jgi:predicted RND superfamily exporter protein
MAVTTFLPSIPDKRPSSSNMIRRVWMETSIENNFDKICQSGYLYRDPASQDELWRISLRVAAFRDVDYGQFVVDLRALIDPYVKKSVSHVSGNVAPVVVTYTGVIPIVYKAQRSLLASLVNSTWWSFASITPLLMLVSRGILAGMVAMLPNILPVLAIFGMMGWLGVPIDIGSMMAASIALGVAVDDTIHYLTWFRHELNDTGCRHLAILGAYRHCATPTVQAAMINGLGLSVFAFSTFMPTRKFGFLMLTILVAGMVAELILLPALLASPLGRAFKPARIRKKNDNKLRIAA